MSKDYGKRPDGTAKGSGWMGELERPDGKVSTEISVGVQIDGEERNIPLIVPGLDKMELQWLLNTDPKDIASQVPKNIMDKAVRHARERLKQGQSPFKD